MNRLFLIEVGSVVWEPEGQREQRLTSLLRRRVPIVEAVYNASDPECTTVAGRIGLLTETEPTVDVRLDRKPYVTLSQRAALETDASEWVEKTGGSHNLGVLAVVRTDMYRALAAAALVAHESYGSSFDDTFRELGLRSFGDTPAYLVDMAMGVLFRPLAEAEPESVRAQ